ncbi:FAD-dependent tricarballylate dehydrogenase TcuA [Peribacillus sp. NPDC046944]|uniref:FAD-dependent tricarballylate dehydrogenase TcuA n=1 Tax=unclassified Peribacillus TaxID=2675266 RepID=UPI003D093DEB
MSEITDIVVIGAGNAALCAAIAAAEEGVTVTILEISSAEEKGGNTAYTHGSIRFAYENGEQVRTLLPDMTDEEFNTIDFGTYTKEQFFDDLAVMSNYRTDYDLASIMTKMSYDTVRWLTEHHVNWIPIYGRQAYKMENKFNFWGGMVIEAVGGGKGLVDALHREALRLGVKIHYDTAAIDLVTANRTIEGVIVRNGDQERIISCKAVILASGGFHANVAMRTQYLGPGWDTVHTRGCKYNVGDGLRMAMSLGARTTGNWSGAHAVCGDRYLQDYKEGFQKLSFPFGIMVNQQGRRFFDEGENFRNYIYAKVGREILKQPGQVAWQIFDAKVKPFIREEYNGRHITKVTANTLEELADKLDGINKNGFLKEVETFNESVSESVAFNPNVLDGKSAVGLAVPKSNWANKLDEGPFEAYEVACGITFTYGGLKINKQAQVIHNDFTPIAGLYAAGEIVGGLYYDNYPGGAGLTSGAVFGKMAGEHAGQYIQSLKRHEIKNN